MVINYKPIKLPAIFFIYFPLILFAGVFFAPAGVRWRVKETSATATSFTLAQQSA